MFKQLTEQDASYLYLETPETPQHVGGLSLVELPAGYAGDFYADYKRHIGQRVHLVPLLHQKLVDLPFDIDHPFWADSGAVDLDYHIRHQTLPRPGRISQLEELVGRLHSNFLDRSRPLWEFYVIDGLESGQVAIYTKIHHAAMDGASSQTLAGVMYDLTPEPRKLPPPPAASAAEATPGVEQMLRGVGEHLARQEIRALQYVPDVLKAWAKLVLPDVQTLRYERAVLPPLRPPKTIFNVAITSQRSYAIRSWPLGRFKRIAKQADATVNDVVLAVCAGALRRYLKDKGALPEKSLTAMVPVSLHKPGEPATGNQDAAMLCTLATDEADAMQRLVRIHEAMLDQKRLLNNIKNTLLPDLSFLGSGALLRGMVDLYRRAKLADRLPPWSNLFISNVPGPPVPLYIAGARLLSMYPCSIPFHGSALNITVQSYNDNLDVGLTACRHTVPDLAELADLLGEALAELEQAASRPPATKPAAKSATKPAVRTRDAAPTPPAKSSARRKARTASPSQPKAKVTS